ncbi:MAG: rna recognition motif containing [Lasallia pustulata]|uniref:Rna recognition motif containing n=1 Tax=Lasallia pustulata TaxID=136370 RepID=A0A5M8PC25_9LECA|nr:MAG: rna recognition motif containing [Lasallia pustulata]
MSGKLDQSLDEILSSRRQSARGRGRGRRAPNPARTNGATVAVPVGGIKKTSKTTRGGAKAAVPSGPAVSGDSKIIVSNLPPDVNEGQIKEYFGKSVGPVKRVTITYGPNGVSRGIATIIFGLPGSANEALTKLNGLLIDKRPMKVEVVLDASRAPLPAPVKGLSERIVQPKVQPKPATAVKSATNGTATRAGGRGRGRGGRRGRNAGRGKPKTAEELDAEMMDYFDASGAPVNGAATTDAAATTNGTAQPGANGGEDLGMDEIS